MSIASCGGHGSPDPVRRSQGMIDQRIPHHLRSLGRRERLALELRSLESAADTADLAVQRTSMIGALTQL
ncbi:MAG: hypothetical protein ACK5LN_03875, partial [Propioniciclava sp.]